uniref:C2H2-type domain-containing protein n=1 Tax=Anopheles minimus TaxID=112268 RepID=A0A182WJD2_9DIPT
MAYNLVATPSPPPMLGKYGEASSGSMKNLDNGLRDRVLYHQNMLSMNLTAEFYHNPFLTAGSGGGSNVGGTSVSGTPTMAQSQKMLNSLVSANHPQQHPSNGSATAAGTPTVPNSASTQQSLTQYQCQLCQKFFVSSAVLAHHMKTHDNNGYVAREAGNYGQHQQSVTSAPSPVTAAVASSSKTSPPLLTQHNIKSEYVGGTVTHTMGQFVYGMAKQFECQICHKSFMTMVNLNLHMKIHEAAIKPIAAAHMYAQAGGGNLLAGSTTGSANYHSTQHHNQQHHTIGPAVPSSSGTDGVCQICHKTFSTADQFTAHMKIHENEFKNRALYHSSSSNGDGSTGGPVPSSNGGGVGDHFYASAPPIHQVAHAPPHLDASKGHRCPICHKMSNNIIEHIKQHEGQLTMGGGGTGSTAYRP